MRSLCPCAFAALIIFGLLALLSPPTETTTAANALSNELPPLHGQGPITDQPTTARAAQPHAPGDEYWAERFGLPGVDGAVYDMVIGPDGALYIGGQFTVAGDVVANGIARWDGNAWRPLGGGMHGPQYIVGVGYIGPYVSALTFGPDGALYVGGLFTMAGGVETNDIARWDGAAWHPLGNGMGRGSGSSNFSDVSALAFGPDGSLYAGGHFVSAGGVAVNSIARWDGSTWRPVGSGTEESSPYINALAFGPDGSLYAGGDFIMAGEGTANGIARWDDANSSWHHLGDGVDGRVYALAFGPDGALYAGGHFTTAGGKAANSIARWDAPTSSWHALGSGLEGVVGYPNVSILLFGPDGALYAGGGFTTAGGTAANGIAAWDGTAWRALGGGVNGSIYALAFARDGSFYAGGSFFRVGEVAAQGIAHWDQTASSWRALALGDGMNDTVQALAFGLDGALYVGGFFSTAGSVTANKIARWDGAEWRPLGSGMGGSYPGVYALAVGPNGAVYAGGNFTTAGGVEANHIAAWDGAEWRALGSGMGGSYPVVYALAAGADGSLYAGGNFTTAGGVEVDGIARWDGRAWHPLGSGMGTTYPNFPYVAALAVGSDGALYAGGQFTTAGGVAVNHIAAWDGTAWHPLGSGTAGDYPAVRALAVGPDGSLCAGGEFTMAGGVAVNHVACWDGAAWRALGSGMARADDVSVYSPRVYALAFGPDGLLYAGGLFETAGGVPVNHIARWQASSASWQPLGSGIGVAESPNPYGPSVSALAFGRSGELYAGGDFTAAGGKPSAHIAKWMGQTEHRMVLPLVLRSR